jgi:hypothetical protein
MNLLLIFALVTIAANLIVIYQGLRKAKAFRDAGATSPASALDASNKFAPRQSMVPSFSYYRFTSEGKVWLDEAKYKNYWKYAGMIIVLTTVVLALIFIGIAKYFESLI